MRLLFSGIVILLLGIIVLRLLPRRLDDIDFSPEQKLKFNQLRWVNILIYLLSTALISSGLFFILKVFWGAQLEDGVLLAGAQWLWWPSIFLGAALAFLPARWAHKKLQRNEEAAYLQYLERHYLIPENRLPGVWGGLAVLGILLVWAVFSAKLHIEKEHVVTSNIFMGTKSYKLAELSRVDALVSGGYRMVFQTGGTLETAHLAGNQEAFRTKLDEARAALPGKTIALVIHGGAGTILKSQMKPEIEKLYVAALEQALMAGQKILLEGGAAMDAVTAAIQILENDSLFNAGVGAVLNSKGEAELDASVMDGNSGKAGAVSGIKTVKNPITLARAVMDRTEHVLLSGAGAEELATALNLDRVENTYFITTKAKSRLEAAQQKPQNDILTPRTKASDKMGTVGAVALDQFGNIAAGTSTGGMNNKKFGRVGDSPIIGAGTYANNQTCGISATGHGEYFIRQVVAFDIHAKMAYQKMSLEQACKIVIQDQLLPSGGTGGVIGLDRFGNIAMEFNTRGMYRGFVKNDSKPEIAIYEP